MLRRNPNRRHEAYEVSGFVNTTKADNGNIAGTVGKGLKIKKKKN